MSLYYFCGDGFARAQHARHDLGADVILCAPGPSMEKVERQPGIFVAALTKAYPVIKPDVFFGLDTPECYDRAVWAESFTKIARAGYQDVALDGRPLKAWPQTFFAPVRKGFISNIFRNRGHNKEFLWRGDTLSAALDYLVWIGARRIYFNGFDLRHVDGKDYAVGVAKKLTPELRERNQVLFDRQVAMLAEFYRLAELNGIECMSTTLGSPINKFMPYRSLGVALLLAKERGVPKPGALMHSFETDLGKKYLASVQKAKVLPFSRRGLATAIARVRPPHQLVHIGTVSCPTMDLAKAS